MKRLICIALILSSCVGAIEKKVANDAVDQYEIALRNGSEMDAYVQSGFVSAAFLQAKDEENYRKWKEIENKHAENLGLPVQKSGPRDGIVVMIKEQKLDTIDKSEVVKFLLTISNESELSQSPISGVLHLYDQKKEVVSFIINQDTLIEPGSSFESVFSVPMDGLDSSTIRLAREDFKNMKYEWVNN